MWDERIRRHSCQNFLRKTSRSFTKSEQCRVSRLQFPWCTHGTPGTMTPFLATKTLAFYDSGFPTDARVIINYNFEKVFYVKARCKYCVVGCLQFSNLSRKQLIPKAKELTMFDGINWRVVTFFLNIPQSLKINLEMMDEFLLRRAYIVAYILYLYFWSHSY